MVNTESIIQQTTKNETQRHFSLYEVSDWKMML